VHDSENVAAHPETAEGQVRRKFAVADRKILHCSLLADMELFKPWGRCDTM
jgi:hypothetical protein